MLPSIAYPWIELRPSSTLTDGANDDVGDYIVVGAASAACSSMMACDVVYIYCSVVRSVLEYACAVWHPGLSTKLSKDIERVQKRCLKIIYPKLSYSKALEESGLVRLDTHREDNSEYFQGTEMSYSSTALHVTT